MNQYANYVQTEASIMTTSATVDELNRGVYRGKLIKGTLPSWKKGYRMRKQTLINYQSSLSLRIEKLMSSENLIKGH
jgi:hypothetical protein